MTDGARANCGRCQGQMQVIASIRQLCAPRTPDESMAWLRQPSPVAACPPHASDSHN